jgi:hypothetical protein
VAANEVGVYDSQFTAQWDDIGRWPTCSLWAMKVPDLQRLDIEMHDMIKGCYSA